MVRGPATVGPRITSGPDGLQ